ncbi:MAG: arylesterase [SAR324 cluster bacterium]|nr:arylesterase [SAR324 cluster bacterium]
MKPLHLMIMMTLWGSLTTGSLMAETKVLILGDSLTEGFGVGKEEAFPARLQTSLQDLGRKDVLIVNAGISGSTSASALSRLRWYMKNKPDILLLALGGNDGLRGLDVEQMRKHLAGTIEYAMKNKVRVLLAGMKMPFNYGEAYTLAFEQVFFDLEKQYEITLIPFLLEGVGGQPEMNLPDGIHPTPQGHEIIAGTVMKYLLPLLDHP